MKHTFRRARVSCPHSAKIIGALIIAMLALARPSPSGFASEAEDIFDRVKHGYADSGGVKIHYALLGPTSGTGNAPLIVMILGFPDFWYLRKI